MWCWFGLGTRRMWFEDDSLFNTFSFLGLWFGWFPPWHSAKYSFLLCLGPWFVLYEEKMYSNSYNTHSTLKENKFLNKGQSIHEDLRLDPSVCSLFSSCVYTKVYMLPQVPLARIGCIASYVPFLCPSLSSCLHLHWKLWAVAADSVDFPAWAQQLPLVTWSRTHHSHHYHCLLSLYWPSFKSIQKLVWKMRIKLYWISQCSYS